jgi:hypothetical protein
MSGILLVTPPLTQLNTAYPATAHLTGFLKKNKISCYQTDLSIELISRLFTKDNFVRIFEGLEGKKLQKRYKIIVQNADFYIHTVGSVVRFLTGEDTSLAVRFSDINFWPQSKRTPTQEDMEWAFGISGIHDKAVYFCTVFIKDITDLIRDNIDSNFELIRYAEKLCMHLPEFNLIEDELKKPFTFIDELLISVFEEAFLRYKSEYVGFTVPFPGNLYGALRCAQWLKSNYPSVKIIFGGGYVNTELRQISDDKIFDYIDYLVFDDGELPLLNILNNGELIRTLTYADGKIVRHNFDSKENIRFSDWTAPDYEGLLENKYLNIIELTNPMHALWSNGRWNKMILTHGCYWGKCAFCDGSLDYISRFEVAPANVLVDRMESVMQQTGISGFHFVDEAASPAILRKLAEEILRRKIVVSYWTNVRFEKAYTPELCYLLAKSGCIAVSGGVEVASPRVLKMINKGITIESAGECLKNLSNAGIMTHAYLMYGFPTETAKETTESLEVVRTFFSNGWLHSAYWHRYAMTIHSPSGINPENYGARKLQNKFNSFANNEIPFATDNEIDLDFYGAGLNRATYNYMNGVGFDISVKEWFK